MRKRGRKNHKTRNNSRSITDFEYKIPKYKNRKPLRKRGEKQSQKLSIIQALLQTLNAKFQNTKIGTIIYSLCVLTGIQGQTV